jgi:hypothetical protein
MASPFRAAFFEQQETVIEAAFRRMRELEELTEILVIRRTCLYAAAKFPSTSRQ